LAEALKQGVYLGDGGAAAAGDSLPSARVQDIWSRALGGSHGEDDGLNPGKLLLVKRGIFQTTHAGQHAKEIFEGAHAFEHFELGEEVLEIEGGGAQFALHAECVFFGNGFGGFLDEADDVAHAEDAAGEAVGVEGLELVEFFAGSCKFDGAFGDFSEGEGGSAAGVAIEFGENDAGEAEGAVEVFGDGDGLLAGGGVADEKDFLRIEEVFEALEFLEEGLVDFLAAGGVEDLDVATGFVAPGEGLPGDFEDGFFVPGGGENVDVDLAGEGGELLDGRGAHEVAGDEVGSAALGFEPACEFGGGGGFAGAVEANDEDAGGFGEIELGGSAAEEGDEFVLKDFDDLLAGRDAAQDVFAEGFFFYPGDEVFGDLVVDVGVEQGQPDFAEGIGDVLFADASLTAKVLEYVLKFIRKPAEHGSRLI